MNKMTMKELLKLAKEKNLTIPNKIKKGDLIKLLEKEEVDVINIDNKPMSKEIIEEVETIPPKFINRKVEIKEKGKLYSFNGRIYIVTSKNVGKWGDTGEVFDLRSIN